jgi:hypothetical protein
MAPDLRNPHLVRWDAQLAACATYAHSATLSLPNSTLLQRPSWGGWSAAEVFEHLCVTDGLYEAPLHALIDAERAGTSPRQSDVWTPTLWGRLLLWSLNPSNGRKTKAPPAFQPGSEPRPRVVDAWLAQVERTRTLMRDADGIDLRAMKLSSPAAKIIRLNAGDAFAVTAVHAERHMHQVRRTLADVTGRREA